jgi:hypothetical protein
MTATRRELIAAAPAVALASTGVALPTVAAAVDGVSTSLAELWRQYEAFNARWAALAGTDESGDHLTEAQHAIGAQIEAADPHDLAGILIQQKLLADRMDTGFHEDDAAFAAAIAGRLERLAGASAA